MNAPTDIAAQGIDLEPRWGHVKLKHLLKSMGSGGTPSTNAPSFWAETGEAGSPWVAIADMSRTSIVSTTAKRVTPAGLRSKGLAVWPSGTLLMSMYASLGHVATLGVPAATNQAILALHPRHDVDPGYLRYWLTAIQPLLKGEANSNTQDNLNAEKVANLPATKPPFEEQRRIAAFLDHETARIDELVHEQERLRTQLLEKRSAVISASATTGLDDEALTRDSGVAWLGEVSSEWSLVRLLHVSRIRSGLVDPTDERFVDFTLIAPNHVESETGRLLELSTAREQGAISGKYRCYHGDVIYSKIRPALAKACLSPGDEVLCSADMYAIAPGERLLSEFLLLFLLSDAFTRFAVLESDRVAMPKINQESLKDCWIPLPPIHEQQVIVERAFAALKDVDALLDESNRLIDLLLERRAALISAAVTGQLDLRDWQSPELEAVAEVA